jgi:hypothetical protein
MAAFLAWFERPPARPTRCSPRRSRTCGSSPSTRSTTATAASRARSPTWRWRARKAARSASTACRRRSAEREAYYAILERTQKAARRHGLDGLVPGCLGRAFGGAEETLGKVLAKARFWEAHGGAAFNARQRAMLNRLLDGFEGKLTTLEMGADVQVLAGHGAGTRTEPWALRICWTERVGFARFARWRMLRRDGHPLPPLKGPTAPGPRRGRGRRHPVRGAARHSPSGRPRTRA